MSLPATAAFRISPDPIDSTTGAFQAGQGAEVQFLGVVRGEEKGEPIRGIDYSAYLPMAERMLEELMTQGTAEKGPHQVFIQHRLGFVRAEEPSIIIRVRTKHSAEAFDLCHWYLREIKTRVPIWKKIVPA